MRKETRFGIIVFAIYLLIKQFFCISEFISGLVIGTCMCFYLFELVSEKTYDALKVWKKNLFRKAFGSK